MLSLQQALDIAVRHHTAGRLPQAQSMYRQILHINPNQPVALHLLGVITHQLEGNDNAVDLITKALTIKPDYAEAHNNLGNVFNDLGRLEEAAASYHRALDLMPDYVDAHTNLNLVLQELGRSSELGMPDLNSSDTNLNFTKAGTKKRFIRISDRDFSSKIFDFNNVDEYIEIMRNSKWNKFKWKDLTLMKDPMTLTIYLQLLQDLQPKTILEFGTFEGGSALWMSDIMSSLALSCHIHTFDIRAERVNLPILENLTFHKLDNFKIREFVKSNSDLFASINHPILVIEDSHENFVELLSCIDEFLEPGDYLIVEDAIDSLKYEKMKEFLVEHEYVVDTYYCDFWGTNNSWNVNSFLKKP
jgi:cephalosporin hydroxylase